MRSLTRRGSGASQIFRSPRHPAYAKDMRPAHYDKTAVAQEGARLLSESLAGWKTKNPDVPVIEQVIEGLPAEVLIDASRTAPYPRQRAGDLPGNRA